MRQHCRAYATLMARDSAEADELAQQVVVRALGHLPTLEGLAPAQRRQWAATAVRNALVDRRRREDREATLRLELQSRVDRQDDHADGIVSRLAVRDALGTLPSVYREAAVMRYFSQMNSAEIGQTLGIPASTVRYRLRVARTLLRSQLE